jgi:hypothetical protein
VQAHYLDAVAAEIHRVGAPVAQGASHETGQVLFTSGFSGPAGCYPRGRPVHDLALSQWQRKLHRGDIAAGILSAPQFPQRYEPPFSPIAIPECSIDCGTVTQRPG